MATKRPHILNYPSVRSDYENWPENKVQVVMTSPSDVGRDFVLMLAPNDAYNLGMALVELAHSHDLQRISETAKKLAAAAPPASEGTPEGTP